jgi:hypothetical protein
VEDELSRSSSTNGGEEEHIYVSAGKATGKEIAGRPRHRWVVGIRMDLGEIKWKNGVVWTGLVCL